MGWDLGGVGYKYVIVRVYMVFSVLIFLILNVGIVNRNGINHLCYVMAL